MSTYRIYQTSGDPYEGTEDNCAVSREFSAAEAAEIVRTSPWAGIDKDGDNIIGSHRKRPTIPGAAHGTKLAARLGA